MKIKGEYYSWSMIFSHAVMYVIAIYALMFFSWENVLALIVSHIIVTGFGIVIGYHRMLSHSQIIAPAWLRNILSLLGAMAFQGGPLTWVDHHRAHHAYENNYGDPHSASRGLFWSYYGWHLVKNPNGYEKKYNNVPDLKRIRFLVFLEKYHIVINIGLILFLGLLLGMDTALWATVVRAVFCWHTVAFIMTSITHLNKNKTGDYSARNIPWLGLITFGESLHENHHANPMSANFSTKITEFDPGYWGIKVLELCGWITLKERRKKNLGRGLYKIGPYNFQ